MSDIVHNRTAHVEKKEKTVAWEYNVMQMVGEVPPTLLHFQIAFQRKITVLREIQKEKTTPIYPLRSSL